MKKLLLNLTCAVAFLSSTATLAQTPGTLTVVYTPTVPAGTTFYTTSTTAIKHLGAAWIETSAGAFVKTKYKWAGTSGITDHLTSSTWATASAQNVTGADVTSGATKTTFAPITFTWNATNVAGTVVADGNYQVKIYSCWNHGTGGNTTSTVAFTKGTTASTLTPTNTSYLKNVSIIWQPANTTDVNETASISPVANVSPNPTAGVFNVDFKNATSIKVLNTLGAVVYEEKIEQLTEGSKNIDLSTFSNGIYFVNVSNGTNSTNHKVVLSK